MLAVVGLGQVGLSTAIAFAYLGAKVTCVDVDRPKLASLSRGRVPFHEPHLESLLGEVRERLCFTDVLPKADLIVVAVGTPSLPDGRPDLRAFDRVAETIGDAGATVMIKSTVPIGHATRALRSMRGPIVSSPEFLRAGSALHDTFYPQRVVIGCDDARALATIEALHRPILDQSFAPPRDLPRPAGLVAVPLLTVDLASAELIKYAANAFLATKIGFANEIAELCERVGADVGRVMSGLGLDERIGAHFLKAGVGWGGSCLGKDSAALLATARDHEVTMPIVEAARAVNERQRDRVVEKLERALGSLEGRTIGLLGLAFKPGTDDVRDAPALALAHRLKARGARVRAHDPMARDVAGIEQLDRVEALAQDADALVLVTEWAEYGRLDLRTLARSMRTALLLDARNALGAEAATRAGFRYLAMGRTA